MLFSRQLKVSSKNIYLKKKRSETHKVLRTEGLKYLKRGNPRDKTQHPLLFLLLDSCQFWGLKQGAENSDEGPPTEKYC